MIVPYEQIASVTQGAVSIEQKEDGMHFHRFTKAQEEGYAKTRFHLRQYATAGIRLYFKTDSKTLYMKIPVIWANGRHFFACDVLMNGKRIGSIEDARQDLCEEYEQTFDLGEGMKEVCIHFPWSVCAVLQELSLDDGSLITPIKREKKIIIFGDSITQGYNARYPSNRYAAHLADTLDAEEFNKAIGGEQFCPWLAELKDDFEPDYISVAYGTNHWHHSTREEFIALCEGFYDRLAVNYPRTTIFALSPIWRKDYIDRTCFRDFAEIEELIQSLAGKHKNVRFISGRHFVPEDETLYSDFNLHPNDEGFKYYAQGIVQAVKQLK